MAEEQFLHEEPTVSKSSEIPSRNRDVDLK
jgi:hypothetical protein